MAYTYKWGVILTTYTYKSWDDPPSIGSKNHDVKAGGLEGHGIFPPKKGENQTCLKPPPSFLPSFPFQRWQKQRPTGTKSHPQQMTQVHHVMCHVFIQIIYKWSIFFEFTFRVSPNLKYPIILGSLSYLMRPLFRDNRLCIHSDNTNQTIKDSTPCRNVPNHPGGSHRLAEKSTLSDGKKHGHMIYIWLRLKM